MDEVTGKVARQYTGYAYPPPIQDIAEAVAAGVGDYGDPSLYAPLFWPEGSVQPKLDILVAGCGTQQAAILAFNNPAARVVGIDLSPTSLAHQRFLMDRHGLGNLSLHQGDLRRVAELGRDYDLIVSTGVLHHLENPDQGLAALRDVLRPRGAMALIVYGAIARTGVYALQEAFRRMGLDQSAESVAVVRRVLAALPADHIARPYLNRHLEVDLDAGIVDSFLHPQDRAYSVPQVLDWLDRNGLAHQAWSTNELYYPDASIPDDIAAGMTGLPDHDVWAAVEAILGSAFLHRFVARHRGMAAVPDFETSAVFLKPSAGLVERGLAYADLIFPVSPEVRQAITRIDGRRTGREIGPALCRKLWRMGAVMFGKP